MIIWIASYPKSGNTWVRSLLSSYLFSADGNFTFEMLNKINQFPSKLYLQSFLEQADNPEFVHKYWIPSQIEINSNNKTNILKTHSALCTIDQSPFTNKQNTLGAIYVVRDPRNVITSLSNHFDLTINEALNFIKNEKKIIFTPGNQERYKGDVQYIGSWANNYNSWSKTKLFPTIIVKYEDLLSNAKETFIKILNFLGEKKIDKKIDKVVSSCTFDFLKKKEEKEGFTESVNSKKNKKKINFFNLGKENKWENLLDKKIEKKIRSLFHKEMQELGYN